MDRNQDKIQRIRFHNLRHSSTSLFLSEGVNMRILQKVGTQRYKDNIKHVFTHYYIG